MDKNRMLLLWVAGGAGVILLYSAVKGKSPTNILETYSGKASPVPAAAPTDSTPMAPGAGTIVGGPIASSFVTDANGLSVDVPPVYASNPDLFIPPVNSNG